MPLHLIDGRPRVEVSGPHVAIWAGNPQDPVGLALDPAAAFEVAKDIINLVGTEPAEIGGVVQRVQITPPSAQGATARLRLDTGAGWTDLLISWSDLQKLADIAAAALTLSAPSGSS